MKSVATKLGLFVLGLATVFAAMFGAGTLVGPFLSEAPEEEHQVESTDYDADGAEH